MWEYLLDQHDLSTHWNSISYSPSSFRDYTEITQQNRDCFLSSSTSLTTTGAKDGSAFPMGLGGIGEVRRVLNIKNASSDGVYTASNILMSSFDNISTGGNSSSHGPNAAMSSMKYTALDKELGLTCKPQHILYCLSGHKMFSTFLPSFDLSSRDRVNIGVGHGGKEVRYGVLKRRRGKRNAAYLLASVVVSFFPLTLFLTNCECVCVILTGR